MLFNSYEFILCFLPLVLALFFLTARWVGNDAAIAVLVGSSLFFYAWWNVSFLPIILGSIVTNYVLGKSIARWHGESRRTAFLLAVGVLGNLLLLGYFKYVNFFIDTVNWSLGLNIELTSIVLPLALSFFTFQQIGYLADARFGSLPPGGFLRYSLFVTYFPQLIAGPIVHHSEMLPQFDQKKAFKPSGRLMATGLSIFVLGLAKKVVVADSLALGANAVFDAAARGEATTFIESWAGVLSYTLQLYFDFSGYCDMATGASLMFGIRLPLNFLSPYKALNIAEFWRRWHITLGRFLRDYLFIPLGGSRGGSLLTLRNLFITMLLGGLWHGAHWNFVIWGGLHGVFLCIHQIWRRVMVPLKSKYWDLLSWGVTMLAVVLSWVFFRAESFESAVELIKSMSGAQGVDLPQRVAALVPSWLPLDLEGERDLVEASTYAWVALGAFVAVFLPSTLELVADEKPCTSSIEPSSIVWRPNFRWGLLIGGAAAVAALHLSRVSEFLYFQF